MITADLRTLVTISRPRFWLYLLGPALLGVLAATPGATTPWWAVGRLLLFFSLPANLFVYGVNDLFDFETDRLNSRKTDYESLLTPDQRRGRALQIALVSGAGLVSLVGIAPRAWLYVSLFLLLSGFYSAPPVRAKERPFLDSAFNVLYVLPGPALYVAAGGEQIAGRVIVAATLWCMAMHAYSAVPDIEPDQAAGLRTVATVLGARATLAVCLALFVTAGLLVVPELGPGVALALSAVYAALMIVSLRGSVARIYRTFPLVNGLAGFAISLTLLLR